MHYWVRASSSDFGGTLPKPRSGHTTVNVGKSYVVVFGGFADKRFLTDIAVYDSDNKLWFLPECTGNGHDGQVGPSPRAFHVAVAIDCHMFIFGGRSGNKRLGDFWVLDTDIWQWTELSSFGDLPSARDFAAGSAIGNRKIVMFGGWDGKKWLSDVYVLDTISLEWTDLSISGSLPPPRCGHTATMLEKRLLVYGGRGGGGPVMGDLWALKGLIEDENETPGWTQLKLPGQAPSPRCGHTVTSEGHYLLLFGGHGTGGWLSRYDIYHNDCIVLDRVSAQWKRLPTSNEPPPARAYHSMTCVGLRFLLFGGFDGKSTYGDLWWLVSEDDPIAKRATASAEFLSENEPYAANNAPQSAFKESLNEQSSVSELKRILDIAVTFSSPKIQIPDESEDQEYLELASMLIGRESYSGQGLESQAANVVRDHWSKSTPSSIALKELGPLLRDYQRLITRNYLTDNAELKSMKFKLLGKEAYHYYHLKNVSQLRMGDIPMLMEEYKQLLSKEHS